MNKERIRWGIIALLLIVVTILYSIRENRPKKMNPINKHSHKEVAIEGLELVESVEGVKEWSLTSKESKFFEDEVRLKGVNLVFFNNDKPSIKLVAEEGVLDRKTRDIRVSSNVVLETLKARITTGSLCLQGDSKILFIQDRFTLTSDGTSIMGKDLRIDPKMERLEIKEGVLIILR